MTANRKTIGIIGLGAFGRFMVRYLSNRYNIKGWDKNNIDREVLLKDRAEALQVVSFQEVCACDAVIYAVPLASLEEVVKESLPWLKPGALVIDVTSVKIKPVEILTRLIPENINILATHPLFGPQSGRESIVGLRIALYPVRISQEKFYRICDYLSVELKLSILRVTPEEHDREMAKVQAVTHFVSRALKGIGLEPSPMSTKGYVKLQEFSATVLSDSWDLFLTIQNGNPYAAEVRRALLDELQRLEKLLN